jgi:tryptophanyl-tRNA synthetase
MLMAADILLYDAELVPRERPLQHLEITRDVARSTKWAKPVIPEAKFRRTAC